MTLDYSMTNLQSNLVLSFKSLLFTLLRSTLLSTALPDICRYQGLGMVETFKLKCGGMRLTEWLRICLPVNRG